MSSAYDQFQRTTRTLNEETKRKRGKMGSDRKPLTIDAWEGFRTSDFDGRIKSGTGEYGPTVSLIRFLPKAHPFGSPIYVARVPAAPFQNSKSILLKNLAPDNLTR